MCLIVIAYRASPRYPLVIAANRDEFFQRPTQEAAFWPTPSSGHPGLLAGQDLDHGGTWLGMTRHGRFAAITNIRDPARARGPRSRGALTRDFLQSNDPADVYLDRLAATVREFAGFNLLVAEQDRLLYLNSMEGRSRELGPGIYGLSNGALDSDWPKVVDSKRQLTQLLHAEKPISTDALLTLMADREAAPDHLLPSTGIPLELERLLSARFIANHERGYGTRCTTAIVVNEAGTARFCEQNYRPDGSVASRRIYQFEISQSA